MLSENFQIFDGVETFVTVFQIWFFLADKFDQIVLKAFETGQAYDTVKFIREEVHGKKKTFERQKILSDPKRSDLDSVHLLTIVGFGYSLATIIFTLEYLCRRGRKIYSQVNQSMMVINFVV